MDKVLTQREKRLAEQVKALIRGLQKKEEQNLQLLNALRTLTPKCSRCDGPTMLLPWNHDRALNLCLNENCSSCRQPAGGITIEELRKIHELAWGTQ